MKINLAELFKKASSVKKIADQAVQGITDANQPEKQAGSAGSEVADYEETLLNIQKAYADGDKDLLVRNSTAASAAQIASWPFPPNPTIYVRKYEKADAPTGPIVIAETVLQEPGKYYLRNIVLVQENGAWKYDIAASEEHPVAQR
jgi:hypothetical protein